eukprot:c7650_g1_i1.p1 GENE.c7650_g1_i1~~c7650_g1_i1.p1  ORF type:complete len:364 (+),score=96.30 c7650_g1_i1:59-1150(+)
MLGGLCGSSRPKQSAVDDQNKILPNISLPSMGLFGESIGDLTNQLQAKQNEIESLETELNRIEAEKERMLLLQQQFAETVEVQEAELSRLRNKMPGGSMAKYWQTKLSVEIQLINELTAQHAADEGAILELQRTVNELTAKANAQAKDIEVIKENMPEVTDDQEPENTSGFTASDGTAGFNERLQTMKTGEMMSILNNGKFSPVFVSLSPNCRDVLFSNGPNKKPNETVHLDDIVSITYPTRSLTEQKKKGKEEKLKEYMSFTIECESKSIVLWAATQSQLVTWCVGLQNISAKPGQALQEKGTFMWNRTQAKIKSEADARGVTPQQLIAAAIRQMLPDDDHHVQVEDEEDEIDPEEARDQIE